MDRVRDMMWDFMDVIDAIRDREENGKCGGMGDFESNPWTKGKLKKDL